jgi:HK97 family phage major capsid protein
MTSPVLEKLRGERDQVRTAAVAIAEGESFDPEDENFRELESRAAKLDKRIESLADLLNRQSAADALDGRLAKATRAREETQTRAAANANTPRSWGAAFVRDDVFKEYRARGQTPRFDIDLEELQTRALPTGIGDLIGAGLDLGKFTVDITPPVLPTPLLSAMSTVTVSTNAIEYVKWAVVAGSVAIVPEGDPKPLLEYAPTVQPDTLAMIAGGTQLTRQLVEDAPYVRDLINNDLRRQIVIKEEAEAASALAAATLPTVSSDTLLKAIRVGIATVQTAGYVPNAVVLNPADWAELDIAVMVESVDGPIRVATYWGLRPIPAPSQPVGTATVGDFQAGVTHFVRSNVSLYMTDSHADTFLSNVFTLLAERRARTAVVRPDALCECTVTAAP